MKMLCSYGIFSAPPCQGSFPGYALSPGLTPWALLRHPFGVFTTMQGAALKGIRLKPSAESAEQHSPGRKRPSNG
jgi:hypothetical protein